MKCVNLTNTQILAASFDKRFLLETFPPYPTVSSRFHRIMCDNAPLDSTLLSTSWGGGRVDSRHVHEPISIHHISPVSRLAQFPLRLLNRERCQMLRDIVDKRTIYSKRLLEAFLAGMYFRLKPGHIPPDKVIRRWSWSQFSPHDSLREYLPFPLVATCATAVLVIHSCNHVKNRNEENISKLQ